MLRSRLKWQCRRGMRELDVLLDRFLEHRYDALSAAQKSAFRQLLSLADPQLAGYLLADQMPREPQLADIVRCIRDDAHTG